VPNLRIGIQLASLRRPIKQALHTAARLGAQAVELDARNEVKPQDLSQTARRQLCKLLADLNLRVTAVSFPTRRGYDVSEDLERRVAATRAAMNLAHQLGASVVINRVGRITDGPDSPLWQTLIDVLSELGEHGHRVGALLAAKTGTESGGDLAQLLAALPSGAIGVDLAPGDLVMNGFSVLEAVEALGPHILHVHASDGVRDLAQNRGLEVSLGRGTVDFPALLAALAEYDYRGWFTIERHQADDPVAEIRNAVEYLNSF
jgi:sugar phosphate isomerase/epimerase